MSIQPPKPPKEAPKKPFEGFEATENTTSGGKQVKKIDTGIYEKEESGKKYYIKSSLTYPADDIAEVVTSQLMVSLIGEERAVPYEFIRHQQNKEQYVGSEIRTGSQSLGKLVGKPKGLGWTSGWLGSNPRNKTNKENIHKEIILAGVQEDMANILATCLLLKEEDCQVENIIFYPPDKKNPKQLRACKFDDGWGLANICKAKNKKVNLFGQKDFFGSKGTHKRAGLPTNHFMDYPRVIHSKSFTEALRKVAEKSEQEINQQVDKQIKNITDAFKSDDPAKSEQAQLKALQNFAKHIGLNLESSKKPLNKDELATYIKVGLKKTLKERAKSMKVLAALLDFKLSIYPPENGKLNIHDVEKQLKKLSEIIQENYPDDATKEQLKKLMPPIEPNLKSLLEEASKRGVVIGAWVDDSSPLKKLLPKQDLLKKPKESAQEPKSESEPKNPSAPESGRLVNPRS